MQVPKWSLCTFDPLSPHNKPIILQSNIYSQKVSITNTWLQQDVQYDLKRQVKFNLMPTRLLHRLSSYSTQLHNKPPQLLQSLRRPKILESSNITSTKVFFLKKKVLLGTNFSTLRCFSKQWRRYHKKGFSPLKPHRKSGTRHLS